MVELARMGKTIFFSTHILADVENICSHIGIVEAGKLVMQGSMSELKARLMPHREIFVTVKDDTAAESARVIALTFGGVIAAEVLEPKGGRSRVRVDYQGDDDGVAALNQTLTTSGVAILGFQEEVQNLESVFMRVTHGIVG